MNTKPTAILVFGIHTVLGASRSAGFGGFLGGCVKYRRPRIHSVHCIVLRGRSLERGETRRKGLKVDMVAVEHCFKAGLVDDLEQNKREEKSKIVEEEMESQSLTSTL